ncbi:unnamed protein product [Peniophora sp. CBMAI 1063]|nr:unnamed protein product [Peniophora sp. CBMAI 1063]
MPIACRGYCVGIESEGNELPHYRVVTDDRTVTCWIPSEAGKAFLVTCIATEPHAHDFKTVRILADGRRLTGAGSPDEESVCIRYRRISRETRQPFVFSSVEIVPDESGGTTPTTEVSPDLGVIEIQIWPARQSEENGYMHVEKADVLDSGVTLSERSKVLAVNHVKPGPTEVFALPKFNFSYWAIGDVPYATFRFLHRPANVLQAQGITPPPSQMPEPSPISTSRKSTRPHPDEAENESSKRRRVSENPSSSSRSTPQESRTERARRLRTQADILELEEDIEEKQKLLDGMKERFTHLPAPASNEKDIQNAVQSITTESTADQIRRLRLQADILELDDDVNKKRSALMELKKRLVIDLTVDD